MCLLGGLNPFYVGASSHGYLLADAFYRGKTNELFPAFVPSRPLCDETVPIVSTLLTTQ